MNKSSLKKLRWALIVFSGQRKNMGRINKKG